MVGLPSKERCTGLNQKDRIRKEETQDLCTAEEVNCPSVGQTELFLLRLIEACSP